VRNTAKFSPALFQPADDTRHDWEILAELQARMQHDRPLRKCAERVKQGIRTRFFGPETLLDLGLRFGPYGGGLNPFATGLTLRKLRSAVHGIDLGPLMPCLPDRLRTPDKHIELAPGALVKDVERVKNWERRLTEVASSNGHLLLIGRRQLRSNNSWLHNSERLVKGNPAKPRCTLLMHPTDAGHRNLTPGQDVLVTSRVGSIVVPLEVTEEVMPGVVSIPHGWGHDRPGNKLAVAQQHPGGSINDLTDGEMIDALCGTAAFSGTAVTVDHPR